MSYESSVRYPVARNPGPSNQRQQKRFLAKYVDKVDDPSKISGVSRFVSGGMGGIISQFCEREVLVITLVLIRIIGSSDIPPGDSQGEIRGLEEMSNADLDLDSNDE